MNLGRAVVKLGVSKGTNAVLFFVGTTVFAQWLSAGEIGVFFLYVAALGVLSIPANLGIRGALEKRLSEGDDGATFLATALAFKGGTLAVVLGGLFVFRGPLDGYFGTDVTLLVAVGVVVREGALLAEAVLRGDLRVGQTAVLRIARRAVWLVVGGALVLAGNGARGLIAGLIAGYVVEICLGLARARIEVGRVSVAHLRSLLLFSKYDTLLSIGGRVYQWLDVLILGFFLTQAAVGAYEIAWRVTLVVLLLSNPLELALFPQISNWNAGSDDGRIGGAVSTAIGFATLISLPAIVGAVLYGEAVLRYLFGAEYAIASTVLVILMVEKLFQSVNDVVGSAVRAIDRPDLAARATVASVGLNLLLSPLLVVSVGITGAAVATTVSWLVNTTVKTRYLLDHVSVDVPYRLLGWYALSSAIMGGGLLAFEGLVPVDGIWSLSWHVAVGAAIYLGAIALIPDVRQEILRPGVRILRS